VKTVDRFLAGIYFNLDIYFYIISQEATYRLMGEVNSYTMATVPTKQMDLNSQQKRDLRNISGFYLVKWQCHGHFVFPPVV